MTIDDERKGKHVIKVDFAGPTIMKDEGRVDMNHIKNEKIHGQTTSQCKSKEYSIW